MPNRLDFGSHIKKGAIMIYGYARVSTKSQSLERQKRDIYNIFPKINKIYEESDTGRKENRKEWQKLLKTVKPGDLIVFDSVSRMSREAEYGFRIYMDLYEKGIDLQFLNEPHINTKLFREKLQASIETQKTGNNATDKLLQSITEALTNYMHDIAAEQIRIAFEQSQKEVDDNSQRTKGGIQTARINGKQIGRPEGSGGDTKKAIKAKEIILKHSIDFGGALTDKEVIKLCEISRNSFYKYKRELKG